MNILFTETVWVPVPILSIALLLLLIAASVYLGLAALEGGEGFPFVMSWIAIMISTAFLAFSLITGGICEKEYVYVNQADVSIEEILEYKVVADLGDVIKLEKIK